ncbi:MAG TPA: hypothetical protein VGE21_11025, partial [Flavobacteriales bacterium]
MTMIKNRPWLQRTKKWALGLLASAALVSSASAQADVTRIDIRLLPFGEDALMVQLRPNNTWTRADGLFNVSFTVRWLTSEGGSLGEPDQIENLPNTCMVVGASLGENPLGEVDHETFRYQNYTATSGTQFPTSCSFAANTWVDFAVLPVTLGAGDCGTFEIVRNVPEGAGSNLSFYIGLGGVEFTPVSTIESTTVQLGSCPPSCIAPTNVVATNNSGTVCSTGSLNLSSSFTGTSDGATFLWTGPAGVSFSPNNTSQNVTVNSPASGTYTVTVTNACGNASGNVSATVTAAPSATISYGSPLCASSTSATVTRTGTAGGTYTAPAAVSINASTGTINPSLSTPGGPYTITYTVAASGDCAAFSTTATV